jgi:predicted O-methyltransferase YrrM
MSTHLEIDLPLRYSEILQRTKLLGFAMPSDLETGRWLRTLAASKPGGRLLELGTGTGLATAWLLDGMSADATLLSVDNDDQVQQVAMDLLGSDARLTLTCQDGAVFIKSLAGQVFDLIFADTWPGKFDHLDQALDLLGPGGLYLIDDLLPQPNWPADHAPKVPRLIAHLEARPDLTVVQMDWSTGLLMASRRGDHVNYLGSE